MKSNTMTIFIIILCFGNTYATLFQDEVNEITNTKTKEIQTFVSSKSDNGWLELGNINMCAYFEDSWYWATVTLYRFENTSFIYRVRYEDEYYTVKTQMEGGEIKCYVLIPYQGENRWFGFAIPFE